MVELSANDFVPRWTGTLRDRNKPCLVIRLIYYLCGQDDFVENFFAFEVAQRCLRGEAGHFKRIKRIKGAKRLLSQQ